MMVTYVLVFCQTCAAYLSTDDENAPSDGKEKKSSGHGKVFRSFRKIYVFREIIRRKKAHDPELGLGQLVVSNLVRFSFCCRYRIHIFEKERKIVYLEILLGKSNRYYTELSARACNLTRTDVLNNVFPLYKNRFYYIDFLILF